jgi:uncharacterized protein
MTHEQLLRAEAAGHPYPLLFATISGAHLYGFPSRDSDYDLRGAHILPVAELVGITRGEDTVQSSAVRDGVEVDLVTHDVAKFARLLLRPNGYVLEQLYSPLIVNGGAEHEELGLIARGCITRRHVLHYLGFARNQWTLFEQETPRRVKPLLYVYRVLLTGIHLMRTGEVEANLIRLNQEYDLPFVMELVQRKVAGDEQGILHDADVDLHAREYERLLIELDEAGVRSALPELPAVEKQLNDFVVRVRLRAEGFDTRRSRPAQ